LEQAAVAIADIEDDAFAMTGTDDDSGAVPRLNCANAYHIAIRQAALVNRRAVILRLNYI
jgi:hypothetical protein